MCFGFDFDVLPYKDLVGEGCIYYILVRIVVCLAMFGELLALVVQTIGRVFLQMCMDCLEKRCVLMIEGYLFE